MRRKKLNTGILVGALVGLILCCPAAQAGFIDNGDGTVTDNGTGLMWQQATDNGTYTWEQALAYCETLDIAGHTDWRMPNAKELVSLVDSSRTNPCIDISYFPVTFSARYWSSTTERNSTGRAWFVAFAFGYLQGYVKTGVNYVRAVRLGEAGSFDNLTLWPVPDTGQAQSYTATFGEDHDYTINPPMYTKLADGCVTLPDNATTWDMVRDDITGLVWEEKHSADNLIDYADPNDADNTYTWYDGSTGTPGIDNDTQDFIADLNTANYGGYADWRLPDEKELQTIVDYGQYGPAINTTYFPGVEQDYYYWSSATYANSSARAWAVEFAGGYVDNIVKSVAGYARAVRAGCIEITTSTTTTVEPTTTTIEPTTTTIEPTTTTVEPTTTTVEPTTTTVEPTTTTVEPTTTTVEPTTTTVEPTTTTVEPTTTTVAPTTTTSISTTSTVPVCIDNDGDSYGDNCTVGPDCDDTDWKNHEGCEAAPCSLTIVPKQIFRVTAFFAPVVPYIIMADKESGIDFGSFKVRFASDAIRSLLRVRIGTRIIIGSYFINPFELEQGATKAEVEIYGQNPDFRCADFTVR